MWPFRRSSSTPSPFGLHPLDELGSMLDSESGDPELVAIVSRRPLVEDQPNSAFVGNTVQRARFRIAQATLLVLLAIILGRSGIMQIAQGASYRLQADANRIRTRVLPAERGVIVDRNGVELAKNTPSFTLVGNKKSIPESATERESFFTTLAAYVDGSTTSFEKAYAEAESSAAFPLMLDVPYERALAFAVIDDTIAGADMVLGQKRSYITNVIPSLSHVLGYTGIISEDEYAERKADGYAQYDRIGKQGIEAYYETTLRGTFGKEITEVNSKGRGLRTIAKEDPVHGSTLTLSVDSTLQQQIETIVAARLNGVTTTKASVVALDPENGEVLALVSWPSYDANLFAQGIDQETYSALVNDDRRPLFPRATSGEYPSGSTIKPVYAAAALTEGIITPSTSFLSTGGLAIGDRFFPDWRSGGHGVTNVYHAIADSVNTFFYYIGGGYDTFQGMGIETLMTWASRFGFGTKTGIDLPTEADGFLPSRAWKEEEKGEPWYIGDTYNVAIGQGDFLVSPLQVAQATAVFANGGTLTTPHIVRNAPTTNTLILEEEVTTVIRDAMRQTVTNGSATSLQAVPVPVAGKTGTAQWSRTSPPHSWFTGFAPFDNPSIVLTVIVEDGGDSGPAIAIAREVLQWYFADQRAEP